LRSKIFIKLLLTQLTTLASIVLVILFFVNWSFQQGFIKYLQQQELSEVQLIAKQLGDQYAQYNNWQFMRQNRKNWRLTMQSANIDLAPPPPRDERPPRRARPPKPRQQVEGGYQPSNRPPPPRSPPLRPDPQSDSLAHRMTLFDQRRNIVFGSKPAEQMNSWVKITQQDETVGWLGVKYLEVATDQLASRFIDQQRQNYIYLAAAILLLSLLVAALWGRQFLRPIHRLARGAKQVTAGKYSARIAVKGSDELANLTHDFNIMAQTLEQNEQLRQQWISDISHELRTPIAVLSAEIEALQDGIRTPTAQRIDSLYTEVKSLGKLVGDLHQLSLADNDNFDCVKAHIKLDVLLQDQVMKMQPRMQEKQLSLIYDLGLAQSFSVYGDQQRLIQLFSNLLENSLRYTDKGGETKVNINQQNEFIQVCIADTTPSVPKESLTKIFDRLYRVDKSRSRLVGGSGLGLSICKNIVDAHQGSISAQHSSIGGLKITVLLPKYKKEKY
jgi:two-component system sensor histidine kinase BaeS